MKSPSGIGGVAIPNRGPEKESNSLCVFSIIWRAERIKTPGGAPLDQTAGAHDKNCLATVKLVIPYMSQETRRRRAERKRTYGHSLNPPLIIMEARSRRRNAEKESDGVLAAGRDNVNALRICLLPAACLPACDFIVSCIQGLGLASLH